MSHIQSWQVSDSFWERVKPLIPVPKRDSSKKYRRKPGGGRKPMDSRKVFEAIVYVLRTGCQWKSLPKEVYGSASSIHAYFQRLGTSGLFSCLVASQSCRV